MNNQELEGKNPNAIILLSTFNGETYIEELMDSLVNQDYTNFRIVVRDDGSSDGTPAILKDYAQRFPAIIELIGSDSNVNTGVKKSFEVLLNSVEADYYLFCDQDDIWESNKISTLIEILQEEKKNYSNLPLLAFSDFRVFDEKKTLVNSYFKEINFRDIDITNKSFVCFMPGCCFCFNQMAKHLYFDYKTEYIHDGHLFLLMQLYGRIIAHKNSLVNYRVHANNVVGYWKRSKKSFLIKDFLKSLVDKSFYREAILSDYNKNVKLLHQQIDGEFLRNCELYSLEEVSNLSLFARKKWYSKHFKPFKKGTFQGVMELLTF